jgi:RNA polymerase sigma-70 factor (ECF subfamily)
MNGMDEDLGARLERQIPALRRYAFALARNAAEADDLVQDCLERALSRWSLRRADGDLRAWLFAILRNQFVNAYHRNKRRGVQVEEADAQSPAGQDRALELGDALAALDLLPEDQKSLLLLVGVEDFSYAEAAAVLGIPEGTVMSRLSRARKRLREILESGRVPLLRRVK